MGSHVLAQSEMTTQVVRKREALERVGNVVSVDGKVQMIEYSDLPDESARLKDAEGGLKLWAGSLAVHALDAGFLARAAKQKGALPFHLAKKKVQCLDAAGKIVEPGRPNAIRFERFIFDLLPLAKKALVVEVDAAEAFAPVKNSDEETTDTPRTAKAAMMGLHRRWLREAGAKVGDEVAVEVNPLWASDADEVTQRIEPGTEIRKPTYFSPDGPRVIG